MTDSEVGSVLLERLIAEAGITSDEKAFWENNNSILTNYLASAFRQHGTVDSLAVLPTAQYDLVVILAWEKVCLFRANAFARASSQSAPQGFGQNKDTPYYKNTLMAKELRERYNRERIQLGLSSMDSGATNSVQVSTVRITPVWRLGSHRPN